MTVGILTKKKDINNTKKLYAYLSAAKMEGIKAYAFNLNDVDIKNKKIYGYTYENGKYLKRKFNYPDIIHNMPTISNPKQKEIFKKITKSIPYTIKYVGRKYKVYKYLSKYNNIKNNLIPTEKINNNSIYFINKFKNIVLKPDKGSKGKGIIFIFKEYEKYRLIMQEYNIVINKNELIQLLNELKNENYLVQKFIECKTNEGYTYDIRVYIQKINKTDWTISYMYARIAKNNTFTSNIHTGGSAVRIKKFTKLEKLENIEQKLETFAIEIAKTIDKERKNKLIELGIDIGIDKNNKLWLFEVNSRPGFPTISRGDISAAKNMMKYIKSLGINE